jgi:hypothetical protein
MDWKGGQRHFLWCGKSGEIDYDFEIKETGMPGKGLGMFLRRDFNQGEKILVERPIIPYGSDAEIAKHFDELNSSYQKAVVSLYPCNNDFPKIYALNCFYSGLFIYSSRINHECLPNSVHEYFDSAGDEKFGVQWVMACRNLPAGTEVTISYACGEHKYDMPWIKAQNVLRGFSCRCRVCTCADTALMFTDIPGINKQIETYTTAVPPQLALATRLVATPSTDREVARGKHDCACIASTQFTPQCAARHR